MTVQCKLEVSGTPIESSARAFTQSIDKVANIRHIKRYKTLLNHNFQQYIRENMYRVGMENVDDLEKEFFINIVGNSIIFGNTNPVVANRYEYGWSDDDDYSSNDYLMNTSPRYYIRPAIEQVAEELGTILIQDMYKEYDRESKNTGYSQYIVSSQSSYLNKYSGIL